MILKSCIWKPVTFSGVTPRTRPEPVKAAVLHTNGFNGPGSLFGAYDSRASSGSTEVAHVQIALDGTAEQYADTKLILGLSWDANDFSVGIESQDAYTGGAVPPWTQAQLDKIDEILRELGVPARGLPEDGSGGGVGYHSKYASWNQSGHNCPGAGKVLQVAGIITRLGADPAKEGFLMALTDAEQTEILNKVRRTQQFVKGVRQAAKADGDVTAADLADENYTAGRKLAQDAAKAAGA